MKQAEGLHVPSAWSHSGLAQRRPTCTSASTGTGALSGALPSAIAFLNHRVLPHIAACIARIADNLPG
jgi:hypothetical protein